MAGTCLKPCLRLTSSVMQQAASLAARSTKHTELGTRSLATLVYKERGDPHKVLRSEPDEDVSKLQSGEVAIKMLFASINPSDLNQIEGTYGVLPDLPSVPGNEGVGEVTAVGSGVKGLQAGDWVLPMPAAGFGTWRSVAKADESVLLKVPNNIPPEYAATLGVNPCTAYRMLRDFVKLEPGDTVIQNGANSQVGMSVVQLAKKMGVRTINILRQRPPEDLSAEVLKNLGADIVVTDDYVKTPAFKSLISDLAPPKLGLNCTGGPIAADMAGVLGQKAVLVTYGGMALKPFTLDSGVLTQKGVTSKGFWITKWAQEHSKEERAAMVEDLADMIRSGDFKLFLERHPFSDFHRAIKTSREPFKYRKVIMKMDQ